MAAAKRRRTSAGRTNRVAKFMWTSPWKRMEHPRRGLAPYTPKGLVFSRPPPTVPGYRRQYSVTNYRSQKAAHPGRRATRDAGPVHPGKEKEPRGNQIPPGLIGWPALGPA